MAAASRGQMTADRRQRFSNTVRTPYQKAMNTAVRILASRDHSKYELKQKLQQRGIESEVIGAVMAECERLNYINDQRTASLYISQLNRKCFGKRHIAMALRKKRLRGASIENLLLKKCSEVEERKKAARLLEKRIKTADREKKVGKKRDHVYRLLYSRGFSKDVITELIRDLRSGKKGLMS
jgi:regulatory protein